MTTATIESTLVQLEGLVNGYQELLSEARAQLETLDVDEAKLGSLAVRMAQNASFRNQLANEAARYVVSTTADEEESEIINRVSDRIYQRVLAKIQEDVQKPVDETIAALKDSPVIEQKVLEMLTTHPSLGALVDLAGNLRNVKQIIESFE